MKDPLQAVRVKPAFECVIGDGYGFALKHETSGIQDGKQHLGLPAAVQHEEVDPEQLQKGLNEDRTRDLTMITK